MMGWHAIAALTALTGCAAQGGAAGGDTDLPNRGIIPYEKVARGEEALPYVLEGDETRRLSGPSAFVDDNRVVLYVAVKTADGQSIARAEAADGEAFGELETVIEGVELGAPSVARVNGTWHLVFARAGAIVRVESPDSRRFGDSTVALEPEADFEKGGIGSPSLVPVDGGFALYYEARAEDGGEPSIARASAGADLAFTRDGVALSAGEDCTGFSGEPRACWDAGGVGAPEVRISRTALGQRMWRLFYTGHGGRKTRVGFAASLDGLEWQRFEYNPVLDEGKERAPSNVRLGDRYLLYFEQGRSVALALDVAGAPSEVF